LTKNATFYLCALIFPSFRGVSLLGDEVWGEVSAKQTEWLVGAGFQPVRYT